MTKAKPKITKAADGWRVHRPGYGFTGPEVLGPYPSQPAALAALKVGTGSASASSQVTTSPGGERWASPKIWPVVIR